jgi:hypothetical protein
VAAVSLSPQNSGKPDAFIQVSFPLRTPRRNPTMLGSLLHFESKPAKKKRKKKKRKKEPVLSSPRTNDHRSPSFLTQSWQA